MKFWNQLKTLLANLPSKHLPFRALVFAAAVDLSGIFRPTHRRTRAVPSDPARTLAPHPQTCNNHRIVWLKEAQGREPISVELYHNRTANNNIPSNRESI